MMATCNQRGFVLVATLWILAIITIGASYFAERVGKTLALAQRSQQATEALLDFSNTRAEILFRLATDRFSVYGLGQTQLSAIALDNRPYRGSGQDILRLQDSRGLINLNYVQPEWLLRLLGRMGVPAEKRGVLLDTLLDYIDTDDLRHLNGAEAAEYRALGLPPPPNDWLISPYQLQHIIGWRDQEALWKDQKLVDLVTTAGGIGFNPNTAPQDVLAVLPGISPEIAERLVKTRTIAPFSNETQVIAVVGPAVFDSESLNFYPGNSFRLRQESDKLPWALQYQISLTLQAGQAPWRIDYYMKTVVTTWPPDAKAIPSLPARIALPAAANEAF
jgi:general secretion pathway protein K